jgi:hypothetical protein
LQGTLIDSDHRRDFREIAGGENLVGIAKIDIAQRCLDQAGSVAAQQLDDPLPCDAD